LPGCENIASYEGIEALDDMLSVRNVTKRFYRDGQPLTLFQDLSFDLARNGRLALLGRNGQGKSTLIKILGGVVQPNAGSVRWSMSSSWPLGFGGGFQGGITGYDNILFLARIYQKRPEEIIDRVESFAQLGKALSVPVKHYSSGMRARLAFGLSLAIEFDCYLIDEIVAVGDALFTQKCNEELFARRADRAFVMASHNLDLLREHCTEAIVIESGRAKFFRDIDVAIEVYTAIWEEHHAHDGAALDVAAE
jgi:capsular polysaccharide transport system ATP-binding protein